MVHENVTTWTCDRCGVQKTVPTDTRAAEQKAPAGWGKSATWLMDGTAERSRKDRDLCKACYDSNEHFLSNTTTKAA